MKLYLTRHGETEWNVHSRIQGQTDTALNETGVRQAGELAERLKKERLAIGRIYTSRQLRAYETAQIVAEMLGLNVIVKDGLEEINLGKWEGYTWKQVRELFHEEYEDWHENRRYQVPPGGESYQQLLERLIPVLHSIIKEEQEDVLVVTHSAVIMTLLSYIYEKPFEDMVKNFKTKNTEIVMIEESMLGKCE